MRVIARVYVDPESAGEDSIITPNNNCFTFYQDGGDTYWSTPAGGGPRKLHGRFSEQAHLEAYVTKENFKVQRFEWVRG